MPHCCWSQTSERLQLSWQPEETRSLSSCGKGKPTRPAHFPQSEHGMAGEELPSLELKCVEGLYFVFATITSTISVLPAHVRDWLGLAACSSSGASICWTCYIPHLQRTICCTSKLIPSVSGGQEHARDAVPAGPGVPLPPVGWQYFFKGEVLTSNSLMVSAERLFLLHIHHITVLQPWVSL